MDLDKPNAHDHHVPDTGGATWRRALLRRGWSVGRRAALAGAAVTAAPVVAPPLLLLSAVVVALSLPFAAYLAGLAAADSIMSALFPSQPTLPYENGNQEDVEEEFDETGRNLSDRPAEEPSEGAAVSMAMREIDGNQEDVFGSSVSAFSDKDDAVAAAVERCAVLGAEEVENSSGVGEEPSVQVGVVPLAVMESTDELPLQDIDVSELPWDDDVSELRLTVSTSVESMPVNQEEGEVVVEVEEEPRVDVQVDVLALAAAETEGLPLVDVGAYELPVIAQIPRCDKMVGIAARKDNATAFGAINTTGMERHKESVHCFVNVASSVTMNDGESMESARSSAYASAFGDDMTDVESRPDSDHQGETREGYGVLTVGFGRKSVSEDEDFFSEEQLMEQLNAIRTITGYRAAPASTLEAELAGLYLFIGVETPVCSRDGSKLIKFNEKLIFLKSIIGLE